MCRLRYYRRHSDSHHPISAAVNSSEQDSAGINSWSLISQFGELGSYHRTIPGSARGCSVTILVGRIDIAKVSIYQGIEGN